MTAMAVAILAKLKTWLRREQRSSRTTTFTRTVIREPGAEPAVVEERKIVEEEEMVAPDPAPAGPVVHVALAVASLAGVTAGALILGWLIHRRNG